MLPFLLIGLMLVTAPVDAAVIASSKEKSVPAIDNVRVDDDLQGFGFDIVTVRNIGTYDVWISLRTARGKKLGDWFVGSFGVRRGKRRPTDAAFDLNLPDILRFAGNGAYSLTASVCPANIKKPTAKGCSQAAATLEYAE
jgi:hypothetical protein